VQREDNIHRRKCFWALIEVDDQHTNHEKRSADELKTKLFSNQLKFKIGKCTGCNSKFVNRQIFNLKSKKPLRPSTFTTLNSEYTDSEKNTFFHFRKIVLKSPPSQRRTSKWNVSKASRFWYTNRHVGEFRSIWIFVCTDRRRIIGVYNNMYIIELYNTYMSCKIICKFGYVCIVFFFLYNMIIVSAVVGINVKKIPGAIRYSRRNR